MKERSLYLFPKYLFYLVKNCNDEKIIKNTPKTLPMLIMSGSMDPVGEDGTGVGKVYELYMKSTSSIRGYVILEVSKREVLHGTFCV